MFAIVEVPDRASFPGNTDPSWFLRVLFSYFLFYFEVLFSRAMFHFRSMLASVLFPQRQPCGSCVPHVSHVPCASLFGTLFTFCIFYVLCFSASPLPAPFVFVSWTLYFGILDAFHFSMWTSAFCFHLPPFVCLVFGSLLTLDSMN